MNGSRRDFESFWIDFAINVSVRCAMASACVGTLMRVSLRGCDLPPELIWHERI